MNEKAKKGNESKAVCNLSAQKPENIATNRCKFVAKRLSRLQQKE